MYRLCWLVRLLDVLICYNVAMKISVDPGIYVAAVSGGVDSMVLLDLLRKLPDLKLVVAHLDHGVREDSKEDRELVEKTAKAHGLPFEYLEAKLGPNVSEADARTVRYAFLEDVMSRHGAQAVITAHHQDDALETAMLNLLRGTGRKGLSSLKSSENIIRPMLHVSKADIRDYAKVNSIVWREDSTNQDERYLRNFVRRQLLTKLDSIQKQQFAEQLLAAADINEALDTLLFEMLDQHISKDGLDRRWFIGLPYDASSEVMAAWLRSSEIREFDRKTIARLVTAAKTGAPGKYVDVLAGAKLYIGKHYLTLAIA